MEADGIVADVIAGLASLHDVGLVRDAAEAPFLPPTSAPIVEVGGARYPDVVPCTCGTGIEDMAWEPTLSGAVGDLRIGIRTSSPHADDIVHGLLAPVLDGPLAPDPDAPPKYSIRLVEDEMSGVRPPVISGLFEDQQWMVMSPDHDLLGRWLQHRIAGWRPLAPTEVRLATLGIVGPAGVALVLWSRGGEAAHLRDAADRGLDVALAPVVIDTRPDGGGGPIIGPGGITAAGAPVLGMVVMGSATSRVEGDRALFPLLIGADVRPGDDVEAYADGLDQLARSVPVVEAAPDDISSVAAALVRRRS
jgi:hypothetical protein